MLLIDIREAQERTCHVSSGTFNQLEVEVSFSFLPSQFPSHSGSFNLILYVCRPKSQSPCTQTIIRLLIGQSSKAIIVAHAS